MATTPQLRSNLCQCLGQLDEKKSCAHSQTDFHGPYKKLLRKFLFVEHRLYGRSPLCAGFEVLFENKFENKTAFTLDLKLPGQLCYIFQREEVDRHIRCRLGI